MKIDVSHASIRLEDDKVIYIDPYNIKDGIHDADYIFITHDHYDHFDIKSINNIKKDNTKIIVPKCLSDTVNDLVVDVEKKYKIDDISFQTVASYNINKPYHKKEYNYVGYNILLGGKYYYIMGDTDRVDEADKIKCDVCFVPIGGIYTMNLDEAVDYINYIKPSMAIPIHYGSIVGDISLGEDFKNKVDNKIEVELLMKERLL